MYTIVNVVGVTFEGRQEILESIHDKTLSEPGYLPKVELIPDPDNQYDKNAVKVVMDGDCVGYIPAKNGRNKKVKKLLKSGKVRSVELEVIGYDKTMWAKVRINLKD